MPNQTPVNQGFVDAAIATATIATALAAEADASTRHAWDTYLQPQPLTLVGTIQRIRKGTTRTIIHLKTADNVWTAILAPFRRLRQGLNQDVLRVGQTIQLVGYPYPDDANSRWTKQIMANRVGLPH